MSIPVPLRSTFAASTRRRIAKATKLTAHSNFQIPLC